MSTEQGRDRLNRVALPAVVSRKFTCRQPVVRLPNRVIRSLCWVVWSE